MAEIIPNVYQLRLPLPGSPVGNVNAYLIKGDSGCLLIDTGWDNEQALRSMEKQLAEAGICFEDISQIVATHVHPDHYGMAGRLKELSQAKLAMHYLENDLVASYGDINKLIQEQVQWALTNGMPANELARELSQLQADHPEAMTFAAPVLPDTTLRGGEIISVGSFDFKVLWTPGHSAGHICLYEPNKEILVSGDHIMANINTDIALEPYSRPNPLGDYLNSLNEIKQLKINITLPGHGNPFAGLQQRIEAIIRSKRQRSSEILETVRTEAKTARQICGEITWMINMNQVSWQDVSPWDKSLAMVETLAHLESMRFSGKVDKFYSDGIIYYQYITRQPDI